MNGFSRYRFTYTATLRESGKRKKSQQLAVFFAFRKHEKIHKSKKTIFLIFF